MKKIASIILLQLFFLNLVGQTNTFPVNGNVGIGTLQPQQKLTVVGKITSAIGSSDYYGAWLDGTSTNALLGLGPWHNQAGYLKWYDNSHPRRLSLYTSSSTENLTFQESGGNVGIGTTNPIKKLDVWSSENAFAASFGTTLSIGQWSGIHFGYKENGNDYYKQAGLVFERTAYNAHAPGKIHILNTISSQSATLSDAKVTIDEIGNMGIGVTSPSEKLSVNGNIRAKKVLVSQSGWPDYVFDSSYSLRSLSEVEAFIVKNKHLPDMPSAKEVEEKGISVGDNQALLLKKIEELTLYLIRQEKTIMEQSRRISKLEKSLKK